MICLLVSIGVGFAYVLRWMQDDLIRRYAESMEESLVESAHLLASIVSEASREKESVTLPESFAQSIQDAQDRRFEAQIYSLRKTRIDLRVYLTDDKGVVQDLLESSVAHLALAEDHRLEVRS